MAANFTIHFGTAIDTQGLITGVNNIMQTISKAPPITVGAQVRPVNTGDAQKVLEGITAQGKALQDVTVRQVTYRNAVGETYTAIVQMTTQYKTKTGEMITQTDRIANGIKGLGAGWTEVQNVLVKAPVGKQIAEFETYYKKQEQAFDKMASKGAEWSTRAEKMGAKEKQAIQESVNLLNQKINLYKQSVSTGNIAEADRLANAVRAQNVVVEENIAKSKRAANAVRSWADNIKNAIIQTLSYTVSLGSLRAAQQLLNSAIQFSIELNKEMTKIQLLQVEGAQSDEEINSLAQSYNALAKELGATTLEVAKGSVEWLRQGKTIAETTELLKSSTMLSKLGNMDAAESTEYLTSAVNGYGMAASEAASIVDKLIAVDNVAATSAKELATALRYSSAVASQAGVPLEKLISYIGVISSTTRQNAEMIGQALKTIFTRMQDIKQGGLDEDGLGLNNVERALRRVDIKLRDSETSFRDMSDVLEELAEKWETLNEVEQANIGKAMAGVRQQNMFMILMTNMNKALELQEVQYNSNGLAVDRYGIYLKSVEASQNRLKASTESLFMSYKDFDNLIITVNNFASSILDLITDAGGLKTVLTVIIGLTLAYISTTISAASVTNFFATNAIAKAVASLWNYARVLMTTNAATLASVFGITKLQLAIQMFNLSNPVGWAILLVTALAALVLSLDTTAEKLEKLRKKMEDVRNEMSGLANRARDLTSLSSEYEELSGKAGKTAAEEERLLEVQNKIHDLMPSVIGYYDAYGNFIITSADNLKILNEELLKEIANKKALLELEALEGSKEGQKLLLQTRKERDTPYKAEGSYLRRKTPEDILMDNAEYQKALSAEIERFSYLSSEGQKAYIAMWGKNEPELAAMFQEIRDSITKPLGESGTIDRMTAEASAYLKDHPIEGARVIISEEGLVQTFQKLQEQFDLIADTNEKMAANDIAGINVEKLDVLGLAIENVNGKWQFTATSLKEYNEDLDLQIEGIRQLNPELADQVQLLRNQASAQEEVAYSLDDLISAQDMLSNAMKEQNDNGQISIDTAMRLIDAGYASALSFNQETGAIYLDVSAMRAANLAKAQLALTTAQAAWAAVGHASALNAEEQALYGTYKAALAVVSALNALGGMPIPTAAPSGGGGGGGESKEKKAIEEKIKALEDEKDALKERLDAFKEYIDAQKESLRLAKEESDFNKEQAKKNKELGDLRTEIGLLALDDSQEARNRRLELEGEAADLETEIAEDSEDRKLELQLEALDAAQEAFEKVIETQMKAIDDSIEGYREQAAAIKSASGGVGGYTSAVQNLGVITKQVSDAIIARLSQQYNLTQNNKTELGKLAEAWIRAKGDTEKATAALEEYARILAEINLGNWVETGTTCFIAGTKISLSDGSYKNIEDMVEGESILSYDTVSEKILSTVVEKTFRHKTDCVYIINESLRVTGEHMMFINERWTAVYDLQLGDYFFSENGKFITITSIRKTYGDFDVFNLHTSHETHNYFANGLLAHNAKADDDFHTGGTVEKHHDGSFAGNLQSNEVFAKLLKGEYVATEVQMNNFMKNVLPNIAGRMAMENKGSTVSSGDTSIKVEINIAGSVDKKIIPEIKNSALEGMNKALRDRGIKRLAGSFSI